ncbi:hypothetical protein T10_10396 [Trichinella papuae]|uniref:Uncharacterized protein n=1 Tax=Trichinella papuae TaxID=268474 RepID=A0A0V1N1J0_9BILA|nr:hypothetical protein T10_10396 [Trichinella papuae]
MNFLVTIKKSKDKQLLAVDDIPLFEALADDNILEAVEKNENEGIDVSRMYDKPDEGLSNSEAYSSLKVSLKWLEQQKEFSTT